MRKAEQTDTISITFLKDGLPYIFNTKFPENLKNFIKVRKT